jgi:hypothetical protein
MGASRRGFRCGAYRDDRKLVHHPPGSAAGLARFRTPDAGRLVGSRRRRSCARVSPPTGLWRSGAHGRPVGVSELPRWDASAPVTHSFHQRGISCTRAGDALLCRGRDATVRVTGGGFAERAVRGHDFYAADAPRRVAKDVWPHAHHPRSATEPRRFNGAGPPSARRITEGRPRTKPPWTCPLARVVRLSLAGSDDLSRAGDVVADVLVLRFDQRLHNVVSLVDGRYRYTAKAVLAVGVSQLASLELTCGKPTLNTDGRVSGSGERACSPGCVGT